MEINIFQIIFSILFVVVIFYIWFRYKVKFIGNFLIGGIILIYLSHLDFLGFKGGIDPLSAVLTGLFYLLLNISTLSFYLFKDIRMVYFIIPIITFFIILLFEFSFLDPGMFIEFKIGIAVRLFVSFFPLFILTYYLKFFNK